jgi:NADPH:quinone reductase-like Zn-dependent oxidoreductase
LIPARDGVTSRQDHVDRRASGAAEINPMLIFARRAHLQGISVGSMQMFEAMNHAIAASGLRPVVDKVVSFDDAPAAYRHLQSARHFGKMVICTP